MLFSVVFVVFLLRVSCYICLSCAVCSRDLPGVIVTLDETGYLQCAYLGTDPSMMVTPAPEARDINYEVSGSREPFAPQKGRNLITVPQYCSIAFI